MTPEAISALLQPYIATAAEPPSGWPHIHAQLLIYLELIIKWNAHTNLTAIRQPEEIVRRHFGESLFTGAVLDSKLGTLLDFGSGAGFPGIPVQLLRPDLKVTLAESQGKKAAFLREAVRTLSLSTEIIAARVETLPESASFDAVALRAVDNMDAAIQEAARRANHQVLILTTATASPAHLLADKFQKLAQRIPLPDSTNGVLEVFSAVN